MYPKILALRTSGRKHELIRVAIRITTKLVLYYFERVNGFKNLTIIATASARRILVIDDAIEETINKALFTKIVLVTAPHAFLIV